MLVAPTPQIRDQLGNETASVSAARQVSLVGLLLGSISLVMVISAGVIQHLA